MHIHARRHVRQRDNIDVIRWIRRSRSDSRRLVETREPLAIAIDGLVNPVTDGDSRSSVWEASVDISGVDLWVSLHSGSECEGANEGRRSGGSLHDEKSKKNE